MLIINGDMPQGCWQGDVMNRTFCDWYDYCRGKCIPPKGFVPSDCPIIGEVPDKHGDLIDEDEFRQVFYEEMRKHRGNEPIITLIKELLAKADNAPVVVEATE